LSVELFQDNIVHFAEKLLCNAEPKLAFVKFFGAKELQFVIVQRTLSAI
jgi:hypothetical protein